MTERSRAEDPAADIDQIPVAQRPWTFFSNHAHTLFCIARDPDVRLRDIADQVGITERATQRILHDLTTGGYIQVERRGRRNRYALVTDRLLRHPVEAGVRVADLLHAIGLSDPPR